MKKNLFSLLVLFVLSVNLNAQESTETGGNQRAAASTIPITSSGRQAITTSNAIAAKAVEDYNARISAANEVVTGDNQKDVIITILPPTREGVNLYSVGGEKVTYDQPRNAFIPVTTREQAVRIATQTFEPVLDEAGKKLKARKANSQGKGADVVRKVKENRSKLKTKVTEETPVSN